MLYHFNIVENYFNLKKNKKKRYYSSGIGFCSASATPSPVSTSYISATGQTGVPTTALSLASYTAASDINTATGTNNGLITSCWNPALGVVATMTPAVTAATGSTIYIVACYVSE